MDFTTAQTGALAGLVAAALTVGVLSISGRRHDHKGLDLTMAVGLFAWMVFLVWQARFAPEPPGPVDEFIEHIGYQLCVAAACGLALSGARFGRRLAGVAWTVQVVGGGCVLLAWTWSGHEGWFRIWESLNGIVVASFMVLVLARWPAYRHESAVGVALLSMTLLLYCILADFWHHPTSRLATAGMFVYPSALFALWFLLTAEIRARAAAALRGAGDRHRQRIAADVHDGIGSQLVAILSSLDLKDPRQQSLALSLEQCLLDLKITVDTLSEDTPSLAEGLAMLRYRIQPSLQRLRVRLHWDVEEVPGLEALPSLAVTNTLRIVQEAVANAMRHAGAGQLTISCRHLPEVEQARVQVIDDGRGMVGPAGELSRRGRGLAGMRRRADEAGLQLAIGNALGAGTVVDLRIPLAAPGSPGR